MCALDGDTHARAGTERRDGFIDASGRKFLPEEATRIYHFRIAQSPDHSYGVPYDGVLSRRRIVSLFDSLELEKKDTVVMAGGPQNPDHVSKESREISYVPMPCWSGDSDCTVLLTFDDIARRLTKERPSTSRNASCSRGAAPILDITGVSLKQFTKRLVCVKVLHKIDTRFANQQLYRHGSLQNYVEQYLNHPMRPAYEAIPRPV